MKNADMPAMPIENTSDYYPGLTKREEIAKANMAALLSNSAIIDTFAGIENVAKEAVRAADALLAALEAQP
jgi:MinD superfamily P-loop ATPase